MSSPKLELRFRLKGTQIPTDHAFPLYAALCKYLPWLHDASGVLIGGIRGRLNENQALGITPESLLRVRCFPEVVPQWARLQGKVLAIDDQYLQVGSLSIHEITPARQLYAHFATIKQSRVSQQDADFDTRMAGLLELQGVQGSLKRNHRRIIRIHGYKVVGYSLTFIPQTPTDSLILQTLGLGGRSKMGGGFFEPLRRDR